MQARVEGRRPAGAEGCVALQDGPGAGRGGAGGAVDDLLLLTAIAPIEARNAVGRAVVTLLVRSRQQQLVLQARGACKLTCDVRGFAAWRTLH